MSNLTMKRATTSGKKYHRQHKTLLYIVIVLHTFYALFYNPLNTLMITIYLRNAYNSDYFIVFQNTSKQSLQKKRKKKPVKTAGNTLNKKL